MFDKAETLVLIEGSVPKGSYTVTSRFNIPEAKYGVNYVQFLRVKHNDAVNVQFNVKPSLKVNPSSAKPGTTVTITGTGFPAGDTGTLTFDGRLTGVEVVTSEVGSFTKGFTVPDTVAGDHKIVVDTTHLYTETVTARLEIVVPKIVPEPEVPKTVIEITPPENNPTIGAGIGLPVDTKCPPQPEAVMPVGDRCGLFGPQVVAFRWKGVSDPSSITYTLEIADNVNFNPIKPDMRKVGLTQTRFTANLEPGTYYWRVKAVDGVGNESQWTVVPYAFKVGELSSLMSEFVDFLKTVLDMVIG